MTGFKSKKTAALDEEGMYLVHHTAQQDATMQSLKDLWRSVCDEVGKAAFAQPVQEPVGYVYSEAGVKHGAIQRDLPNGTPFYTNPPQRPWVDLTDEEKDGKRVLENGLLFNAAEVQAWELGVDYAEAKLKEKNT
jgi:hypothetical protein